MPRNSRKYKPAKPQDEPSPEGDAPGWFIFTAQGKAGYTGGVSASKALANWKRENPKSWDVIGLIRASMPIKIEKFRMHTTDVFGVVCCVQGKPRDN